MSALAGSVHIARHDPCAGGPVVCSCGHQADTLRAYGDHLLDVVRDDRAADKPGRSA